MNLTQIAAFKAVMTSDTMSDAANKLGRTQPAVSAAIKALEESLGMPLFERRGRKLVPVPEARYLLSEADSILGQLGRVSQTMRSLAEGQSGSLNVVAMPGPAYVLFPRFIAAQIANSPDVTVSMYARSSTRIEELARAQSIDFGFADAPTRPNDDRLYEVDTIAGDCFLALPPNHELAASDRVSLRQLDGQRIGALQGEHAHQRDVQTRLQGLGCRTQPVFESQTFLPILQFVAAGHCCAILDPLTVVHLQLSTTATDGIVVRPLVESIRYRYAIYAPSYRPLSQLSLKIRVAWHAEVIRLLQGVAAHPTSDVGAVSE